MQKSKKAVTPTGTKTRAATSVAAPRHDDDDVINATDTAPPPRTGYAMRELGIAQNLVAELFEARKRATAALSNTAKHSIRDAAKKFLSISHSRTKAEYMQMVATATTEIIQACDDPLAMIYAAFQPIADAVADETAQREWHAARVKTTWSLVEQTMSQVINEKGIAFAQQDALSKCLSAMALAAANDQLFAFSDDKKNHVSRFHRPWAALFRAHLAPLCIPIRDETLPSGMTVERYVADHDTALHEMREQWTSFMDDDITNNIDELTAIVGAPDAIEKLRAFIVARQASVYDRVQRLRWIHNIDTTVEEITDALISLQIQSNEEPFYRAAAMNPKAARAKFKNTTPTKKKPTTVEQQYVGVLDAPTHANHSLIRQRMHIGDTGIEATIDPGATITLIDTALVSSLNANVARRAHHIAPTRIAAWNGTVSSDAHDAWLVAVRPIWCNEPHWVTMYAAPIGANAPGPIIWGVDAAASCGGMVLTITPSGAAHCEQVIDSTQPPSAPTTNVAVAPPTSAAKPDAPVVAVVFPDPSRPGIDGTCSAREVVDPAEAAAFDKREAIEVAFEHVDSCAALQDRPDLQERLQQVMRQAKWHSKRAPPPAAVEPAIKGHVMRTRLQPGSVPEFRARVSRMSAQQRQQVSKQTAQWLKDGTWYEVTDDSVHCTSPLLVVNKFDDQHNVSGYRVCGDFREANKHVVADITLPPRIEDVCDIASRGALRTKLDCASYYTQFMIDEVGQQLYTVQMDRDLVARSTRMQFGMRNAGSVAQRATNAIFVKPGDGEVAGYSDEIVRGHEGTIDQSVDEVCALIAAAADNNVILNADKLTLLSPWIVLMGHEVGPDLVRPLPRRMQLLLEWPAPETPKQLVSFLAAASHYRAFLPSFAVLAADLRAMAMKGRTLQWNERAQVAFMKLRRAFADAATLRRIDPTKGFSVHTDGSNFGIAFAVGQRDESGVLRMVASGGRSNASYEQNYNPFDIEASAVLFAFQRMPELLVGGNAVEVVTDSRALCDFFNKAPQIESLAFAPVRQRLAAALQGINCTWRHIEGELNTVMDAASRAAWKPDSGLAPAAADHKAHTLLPPMAPVVAVITPVSEEAAPQSTPQLNEDDDDVLESDDAEDSTDLDETELRSKAATSVTTNRTAIIQEEAEPHSDSLLHTPLNNDMFCDFADAINDAESLDDGASARYENSDNDDTTASDSDATVAGGVEPDDATASDSDATIAGGVETATTAQVPLTPQHILNADDNDDDATIAETSEEHAQAERKAWAQAQRYDTALHQYFSQAHGIKQHNVKVRSRKPTIDSDGRLFVEVGPPTGTGRRALCLAVPRALATKLVVDTHEDRGHRAADATIKALRTSFWWPGMNKQVHELCASCVACQTRLNAPRATPDLNAYPRAGRFEAVHMDIMPMPPSAAGNTCALVLVDRTTGVARAIALKSKRTEEVIEAYKSRWVDEFGPPKTLHPDGALELNSNALRSVCRQHGTRISTTAPYNKQANGLAERFIQTVKRGLLSRLQGSAPDMWDRELSKAVSSYMTSVQTVRGNVSPYQLTYGQAPVLPQARALQAAQPSQSYAIADGAAMAQAIQQKVDTMVAKAQAARDKAATKPLAAAQAAPKFEVGDVVWVENTEQAAENTAFANRQKRFGPYIVHAHDKENARVQLRVLATGRVASSRMPGKKGDPTWFATRRLTKVVGDVTKPQGSWLGMLDRNALSSTERATQVELDMKESKFREQLRARESRVAMEDARNVKFIERRIVDVVALRQTPAGPIVTVVLANGRAVEVPGKKYSHILGMASRLHPEVQRVRAHNAPDLVRFSS